MIEKTSSQTSQPSDGYRFVVVVFCFILVLVNYLDRVVISFGIKPIKAEFGIGDGDFGMLMSAFAIGTLCINGLSGFLLDRFGVKLVWGLSLFAWSIVMLLQGMVEAFWVFLLLRVLLGIGEGPNFPAMNRALVDWMRPSELGRALSLSLIGVPLALLLGGLVLPPLITNVGWRGSFITLGCIGIVLGILFVLFYRQPPTAKTRDADAKKSAMSIRSVMLNPTLLATAWSFFGFGWVLFFGLTWLPGYLEQDWNMKLDSVGLYSTLPWGVALVLMPIFGWLSDFLMQKTGRTRVARVHLIWICQLIAVVFFIPVIFVTNINWAVIFISLAIGFSMAPNSPYYSICADLFPGRTGVATGVIVTFFSAAGVLCPIITGWLAEGDGGFGMAFTTLCIVVGSSVLGLIFFATGQGPASSDPPNQSPE